MLYGAYGGADVVLTNDDLREKLYEALDRIGDKQKIMAIPPDFTRFHSKAGLITKYLWQRYGDKLTDVLPALGTHSPMTDEQIGRVVSEFERLGMYDDTLIVFIADHGDMMGAHRMHKKGVIPYDELYRVPFIVKPPGWQPFERKVIDDLLCSQSVPGTILSLAGLDIPQSFTGGDFADSFTRTGHPEDERIYFEHYLAYWGLHPFFGVRTRDRKYIRYYGADDTEELYDLDQDPLELINVAGDIVYKKEKRRLAEEADEWWRSSGGRDVDYYESEYFRNNKHNDV